jgi:hypothetical protein
LAKADNYFAEILQCREACKLRLRFTLYRAAKIPVEVHVFTRGQHAFGMGSHSRLTTIKDWPERLADWMGDNNILKPAVPAKGVK